MRKRGEKNRRSFFLPMKQLQWSALRISAHLRADPVEQVGVAIMVMQQEDVWFQNASTTTAMIFRGKYCNTLELVISDSYGNHGPFSSMIYRSKALDFTIPNWKAGHGIRCTMYQWIGLRENPQETRVIFPLNIRCACKFSLKPIH